MVVCAFHRFVVTLCVYLIDCPVRGCYKAWLLKYAFVLSVLCYWFYVFVLPNRYMRLSLYFPMFVRVSVLLHDVVD